MAEENMNNNSWQNNIAALIGVLIAAWICYNYLYLPKMKEIDRLRKDIKIINQEISIMAGGKEMSEDKLREIKASLQAELDELSRKIPAEKETPYLINSFINRVGKGINIDYKLIQPLGIISENRYKRIPIKVEFDASYYGFNQYLEQLKSLPATIRVDNLDLYRAGKNRLSVRMDLSAFVVPGGTLPEQKKETIDLSKVEDPFYKQSVIEQTTVKSAAGQKTVVPAPNLRYSGFLEGKQRRAIINDVPLAVGEQIMGYTVTSIYKDKVVLKKAGKLYTLGLR